MSQLRDSLFRTVATRVPQIRRIPLGVALLCLPVSLLAAGPRVDNFLLLDHAGEAHELYYHQGASAVVLLSHASECSVMPQAAAQINRLKARFAEQGVVFFMINSNIGDQRADLSATATDLQSGVPILDDETQLIGEALNLDQAGELLILEPETWQIAYRGAPEQGDAALSAVLDGADVPAGTPASGCEVAYPHADAARHANISYSRTIAPLLQEKCVMCHTEGGLGPWAMSNYNMILGFAPMIREVVRTRRMPPWHADPHVGVWKNDISLNVEQTQALIHWIEAGAPRGNGPDPLAETKVAVVEWPLGEPDLVLDIPAYSVPASGVVDYQFPSVTNPLDTGVWVKAASVVPGDREVVHHILAGTLDADTTDLRRDSGVFDNYLIGYAPGNESHTFPEGTGVYVPPGGEFSFQMHYTPVGRETVDRSRIGLYFHKQQPDNFYRQDVVVDPTIRIPPGDARHAEVAYYQFDKAAVLHDLVPHAHYRGVASRFELHRPDGAVEVILSVPNYDFNWQRTYEFVEPKRIEPGTRLVHTTWYDNSAANPGNPDPEREVPWGLQSWDEMLYGAFSFTYVDESTEAPIYDRGLARTTQYVGFLDKDLDGKLSWKELPKEMKKRLVQGFKAVDKNGDGGLDIQEMYQLSQRGESRPDVSIEANTGAR